MVVRPDDATNLARGVRAVFAQAEADILRRMARYLAAGVDAPDWQERKLAGLRVVLRDVDVILARLDGQVPGAVEEALGLAYNRGVTVATQDLSGAGVVRLGVSTTGSVAALVAETLGNVQPALFQVRRAVADVYREAVTAPNAGVLAGTVTRREASRATLSRLAGDGVTGFRDKAGRNWSLPSYAEMAARTGTMNAMTQGASDRIADLGIDTVLASDSPEECSLCRPYEGKVLSLTGRTTGTVLSDGVRVFSSLAAAKTAGFLHPSCRHGVTTYLPGITKPLTDTADPEGNKLRVQQRAFERRIRELKRRDIIDQEYGGPQARKTRAQLRAKQSEFREWRETHNRKNLNYRTNLTAR